MKYQNPMRKDIGPKSKRHLPLFLACLVVLVALGLINGCSVQNEPGANQIPPTPEPTSELDGSVALLEAKATKSAGEVLANITRAPDKLFLATFTPIPTVTSSPSPTPTTEPSPTATPTETPTEIPTETEEAAEEAAEVVQQATSTPEPTPPLPELPEVLKSPAISQTIKVPILMYHYVSTPPEDADKYRVNLSVEPDTFRAQLQWLKDRDYETVDLYDIIEVLANSEEPPEKWVVLTFDDGYIDNYEVAYPIMQEFGYTGTFFIPTEFIDFGYEGYMTWDMIKEMAADGNRFESHTKNHPDLSLLKRNDHVWQILGSQETLAYHLGYKPRFLSYPSGRYSDLTLEMVETLSLWGAVTTQGGTWRGFHDRYEWKRTRVSYGTTLGDFEKVFGPD